MLIFAVIEEGGVKMKLTVVDTPGFGDQINNENWWVLCDFSVKARELAAIFNRFSFCKWSKMPLHPASLHLGNWEHAFVSA